MDAVRVSAECISQVPVSMSYKCVCGRKLANDQSYSKHTNGCKVAKKDRRRVEAIAQELYRRRRSNTRPDSSATGSIFKSSSSSQLGFTTSRSFMNGNTHVQYHQVTKSESPTGPSETQSPGMAAMEISQSQNLNISTEAAAPSDIPLDTSNSPEPCNLNSTVLDEIPTVAEIPNSDQAPLSPHPPEQGRSKRRKFLPWKRREILPEGPGPLLPMFEEGLTGNVEPPPEPNTYMRMSIQIAPNLRLRLTAQIQTAPNSFGLYRIYHALPSRIPDEDMSVQDLSSTSDENIVVSGQNLYSSDVELRNSIWPYPNISCFRLGEWFWLQGETKSLASLKALIDVLRAPDFRVKDVLNVSWESIRKKLATRSMKGFTDDWVEHTVSIRVPTGVKRGNVHKNKKQKIEDMPVQEQLFTVKGVWIRPLVSVIKETFTCNPATKTFHMEPFKQYWEPSPGEKIRVYDEIYSSDHFLRAHEDLQNSPKVPGCDLPRAIAALMFWSDATSLAQFGNATLWPIYLYWGNQSKYERCRPSADACQHIAYLPKLPDTITDFIYNLRCGKAATQALLTHCRRELYHAAIKILLDESFQEAWKHGIVTKFIDHKIWRIYPRVFTWSADYPEKVYLSGIKDGSMFLCPSCDCQKSRTHMLGTVSDQRIRITHARVDSEARRRNVQMARDLIYEKGFAVDSERVKVLLEQGSWAPTENAFSAQLRFANFNYFQMLPCDLMHEVELGVWKSLLTHLIRMLWSIGSQKISIFNQRFREVPGFGRSTIRRFGDNVSDLKKLAAHNYEDILQCIIPVFEGLLPEPFNDHVLTLLWELCTWHALAKLRIQTETTLIHLDSTTTSLGAYFRRFVETVCPEFNTHETPSEVRARNNRLSETRTHQKKDNSGPPSRLSKQMNINTFKFHMLGHYSSFIHLYGTTDSFTTMIGETAHRVAKARYRLRTNKRDFLAQLANLDSTVRTIKGIKEDLRSNGYEVPKYTSPISGAREEPIMIRPEEGFYIGNESKKHFIVGKFCEDNHDDPAVKNFLEQLKDHLLTRMKGEYQPGDEIEFTTTERNQLFLQHGRIYKHNTMRINYTTYDVRREQDYINITTGKQDIIVAANEDEHSHPHPYWYARVQGIFHANVQLHLKTGHLTTLQRFNFLWVRWFGRDLEHRCGWKSRRLDKLGFVPHTDPQAFGFLDPAAVIRTCHLIPAFEYGRTDELCPPSVTRDPEGDWRYFYVNRFVDRDMFMRYLGGGIGHIVTPPPSSEDAFEKNVPVETCNDELETDIPRSSDPVFLTDWDSDYEGENLGINDLQTESGDEGFVENEEMVYDEGTEELYIYNSFNDL